MGMLFKNDTHSQPAFKLNKQPPSTQVNNYTVNNVQRLPNC